MAKENMIFISFRLNVNNSQHVKINNVLKNLNPDIYKSKNQFVADAVEYYIDHFGEDSFTAPDEKKDNAFVTRGEMEFIKVEMIDQAVTEARNEVIRILGGVVSGMQPAVAVKSVIEPQNQEEIEADEVVSGLASKWM